MESSPVSPGAPKGGSQSRFFCGADNCGKSFSRREHLDRHSWNHRDCPDITCKVCRAHFKRRDLLGKGVSSLELLFFAPSRERDRELLMLSLQIGICVDTPRRIGRPEALEWAGWRLESAVGLTLMGE